MLLTVPTFVALLPVRIPRLQADPAGAVEHARARRQIHVGRERGDVGLGRAQRLGRERLVDRGEVVVCRNDGIPFV